MNLNPLMSYKFCVDIIHLPKTFRKYVSKNKNLNVRQGAPQKKGIYANIHVQQSVLSATKYIKRYSMLVKSK